MPDKILKLYRRYPDCFNCSVIVLAAVLGFIPALGYELFALDDSAYVGAPYLFELTWSNIKYHLSNQTVRLYSPLVMLSFMPDYLVWGSEWFYAGCRFQNILWHASAMVLFYLCLRELELKFKSGSKVTFPPLAALFAALAAALHPQRVESVVWISERKDCLVLALGLAAIYTFIRACRRDRVSFASPVLLFISLAAVKPLMISVPVILTIGYLAGRRQFSFRDFFRKFGLLYGVTLLYLIMHLNTYTGFAGEAVEAASGGAGGESRIFIASCNIWRYIGKTLLPIRLNPLYPFYQPGDVSYLSFYLLLLAAAVAVVAALIPSRNREFFVRAVLPAGLMFGAAVLPVCNLNRIGNADFADRYSYFPSLFIWMAVAAGLSWLYRKYPLYRRFIMLVPALYVGVLLIMTELYIPVWKNTETQLDAMLDTSRPHAGALKLASWSAFKAGSYDEALNYAALLDAQRSGLMADKYFTDGMIGLILTRNGQVDAGVQKINSFLEQPDWHCIADAPKEFVRSCLVTSGSWHLKQKGSRHKLYAANLFEMASQIIVEWNKLESLNFLGIACMIRGDLHKAETAFLQALKLAPSDENIRKNLESVRQKLRQSAR